MRPELLFFTTHSQAEYIASMAWRNQGITGSNNIPLGNRRKFGDVSQDDGYRGSEEPPQKRGRSPERGEFSCYHRTNTY
jgi:hypothetical protein